MNKIIITGNLGSDATIGEHSGQKVINFNVGVSDDYKDQSGNWVNRTIWYSCSFWSQRSADRLLKGTKVMVMGTPRLTSYVDRNGASQTSIKITVSDLEVLHSTVQPNAQAPVQPSVGQAPQPASQATPTTPQPEQQKTEDDLPF
jgi:single stranded DNA-binding protein